MDRHRGYSKYFGATFGFVEFLDVLSKYPRLLCVILSILVRLFLKSTYLVFGGTSFVGF